MGRWEPGAAARLRQAALDLYAEQGFEGTTVADIAARAGVTARTFFRHFADKREVLFGGWPTVQAQLADAVRSAPAEATPMEAVGAALDAADAALGGHHEWSSRRQGVIDSTAELRERELIKMASLSSAFAGALRDRGVTEPEASLAAEAGVVALRVGFGQWVAGPGDVELGALLRDSLRRLGEVTAAADRPGRRGGGTPG